MTGPVWLAQVAAAFHTMPPMPREYIETTIPSFYFETRTEPRMVAWREATREWWDQYRSEYELVTSEVVIQELNDAPPDKAESMTELLEGIPRLSRPPGLVEVAEFYLLHRLMPSSAELDAAHLALASLHNIEYLLTWNIRHLANANKVKHLAVLNARLGLPPPIITTPELLIPD